MSVGLDPEARALVLAARGRGSGWAACAAMVGKPIDTVRRDLDPDYRPVHAPAGPVAREKPSVAEAARALKAALKLSARDAEDLAGIWRGEPPRDLAAQTLDRLKARLARIGIGFTGAMGWRLTAESRRRLDGIVAARPAGGER